ncbi:sodium-translocating pyrophosphatase [Candidatus Bathyarchaeota archaeon]|nr:sodium-translocating pyrophosphatase [Candidatus Bathyarchaeota archaeon]
MLIAPLAGIFVQIFSAIVAHSIFRKQRDFGKISEISEMIKRCAVAYLNRQFSTVSFFGIILALLIGLTFGFFTALTFSIGAILSALSAYVGTIIAVNANSKTARDARQGTRKAFLTAFQGGTAIGLISTGLSLLVVSGLYLILSSMGYMNPSILAGLGFGASLVGLFARVGGGIYTKAADISADLVGKVEMGLVEDDPRNPAVIADQVGDNVGDVAGTGSDVFQSYVCTLVAAIILGTLMHGNEGVAYPMLVLGAGLLSSIIGSFAVKIKMKNIRKAIDLGIYVSAFITALFSAMLSQIFFNNLNAFYIVLTGIIAVVLLAYVTEYYTLPEKKPVNDIVKLSEAGPATNVLAGLATGLESTAIPTIIFLAVILLSYYFDGLYGLTLAAIGFLSINATLISIASYGPIVDNANGLITVSESNPKIRKAIENLDAVGNATKAICKVYAIGTSVLAQVALFSAYIEAANLRILNAADPVTIAGMLVGGMLTFLLCSLVIRAVHQAAYVMIMEIRRQFSEGFGAKKPDYIRCIDISTRAAIKNMFYPALLSTAVPFLVGLLFGPEAMGGLIAGNLVTMLPVSLLMCISGASWDNAKKFVESNILADKRKMIHVATVIGDTVGDPLKDAAGPSLDIFINLIGTIALIYAAHLLASI